MGNDPGFVLLGMLLVEQGNANLLQRNSQSK
jgi:hypothetical protein